MKKFESRFYTRAHLSVRWSEDGKQVLAEMMFFLPGGDIYVNVFSAELSAEEFHWGSFRGQRFFLENFDPAIGVSRIEVGIDPGHATGLFLYHAVRTPARRNILSILRQHYRDTLDKIPDWRDITIGGLCSGECCDWQCPSNSDYAKEQQREIAELEDDEVLGREDQIAELLGMTEQWT